MINDVDKEETSFDDWPAKFDNLVQRWIDQNPEKSEKCANELVALMKEYSELVLE